MKFVALALTLSIIALPAMAQTPTNPTLDKYLKTNTYYNELLQLSANRVFRLTYPQCMETVRIQKRVQDILLPAQFPNPDENTNTGKQDTDIKIDSSVPDYGQWIDRTLVTACDNQLAVNHLGIAYDGPQSALFPLLNGQTRLGVIDQPFAVDAVSDRLHQQTPPCKASPFIEDTTVFGYRSTDGKSVVRENANNGWFETWTIRACGTQYTTNLAILPDEQTRYRYIARLNKPGN